MTGIIANSGNSIPAPNENFTNSFTNEQNNSTSKELIGSHTIQNSSESPYTNTSALSLSLSALPLPLAQQNATTSSNGTNNAHANANANATVNDEDSTNLFPIHRVESSILDNGKTNKETEEQTTVAATIELNTKQIQSTKQPLIDINIDNVNDNDNLNHMQTSEFISSSNTRRETPLTTSTAPITTNKPSESKPLGVFSFFFRFFRI